MLDKQKGMDLLGGYMEWNGQERHDGLQNGNVQYVNMGKHSKQNSPVRHDGFLE